MCDNHTVEEDEAYVKMAKKMSRRHFGKLSAGAAMMMMLPPVLNAQDVMEMDVNIETPDGTADCYFVHPTSGKHAAVIIWPDILGLRPAFRAMGKRLAQSGYSVLVINPFYRIAKSPVVAEGASFSDPAVSAIVRPMAGTLNAQTHLTDARAFVAWVDKQSAVDTSRKMGTTGYCMGGAPVLRTAAAFPDRIGAAGTFHGAGLTTNAPDSPHLSMANMKAALQIAIAANDDERDPESKNILRSTAEANGLKANIQVYTGANHGWCVPDFPVYDQAQADRAWSETLAMFETALA